MNGVNALQILFLAVPLLLVGMGVLLSGEETRSAPQNGKHADSTKFAVSFEQHIAPLLKTNCSPCHFEGGQVFGRYPFDDYTTVKKLGEKLNTRLKENEQQSLIAVWLKTGAKEK